MTLKIRTIDHAVVMASDMERSIAFYCDTLGGRALFATLSRWQTAGTAHRIGRRGDQLAIFGQARLSGGRDPGGGNPGRLFPLGGHDRGGGRAFERGGYRDHRGAGATPGRRWRLGPIGLFPRSGWKFAGIPLHKPDAAAAFYGVIRLFLPFTRNGARTRGL